MVASEIYELMLPRSIIKKILLTVIDFSVRFMPN